MTNGEEIVGRGRDHSEAYDEFAKNLVIAEAQRRGFSSEPDSWTEEELAELQATSRAWRSRRRSRSRSFPTTSG